MGLGLIKKLKKFKEAVCKSSKLKKFSKLKAIVAGTAGALLTGVARAYEVTKIADWNIHYNVSKDIIFKGVNESKGTLEFQSISRLNAPLEDIKDMVIKTNASAYESAQKALDEIASKELNKIVPEGFKGGVSSGKAQGATLAKTPNPTHSPTPTTTPSVTPTHTSNTLPSTTPTVTQNNTLPVTPKTTVSQSALNKTVGNASIAASPIFASAVGFLGGVVLETMADYIKSKQVGILDKIKKYAPYIAVFGGFLSLLWPPAQVIGGILLYISGLPKYEGETETAATFIRIIGAALSISGLFTIGCGITAMGYERLINLITGANLTSAGLAGFMSMVGGFAQKIIKPLLIGKLKSIKEFFRKKLKEKKIQMKLQMS
jgi:hypothetical protein